VTAKLQHFHNERASLFCLIENDALTAFYRRATKNAGT
jgi:hypothetical protein